MSYRRVATLKTAPELEVHLRQAGADLHFDTNLLHGADAPLQQPCDVSGFRVGNRFCILPMEGWDANPDGTPSELVHRRWRNFGESGAKLIWGGEAVAVRHDGRANPNQLLLNGEAVGPLERLRADLISAHAERFGSTADLLVGLQLTHSGRFSRPNQKTQPEPRILYHHPFLDSKVSLSAADACLTDAEIEELIDAFVLAAVRAQKAGFAFVDLKHCHGYLGHEFLSAHSREGRYGGSFENRTRFLCEVVAGIRRDAPGLMIAVRLSAFDGPPFRTGPDGRGVPERVDVPYRHAFGADPADPLRIDLSEADRFLDLLTALQIPIVCISGGSPYYTPHLVRPALFPPSDGYQPPEDPLIGVARHIAATSELKSRHPDLVFVGSGYTYLQEWLPNVAQHYVRTGQVDFVGLGRMALSYHDLPHDVLRGARLDTKRLCRSFSDCTTGPRKGLVSGCFPLDPFYRSHPDAELLKIAKTNAR